MTVVSQTLALPECRIQTYYILLVYDESGWPFPPVNQQLQNKQMIKGISTVAVMVGPNLRINWTVKSRIPTDFDGNIAHLTAVGYLRSRKTQTGHTLAPSSYSCITQLSIWTFHRNSLKLSVLVVISGKAKCFTIWRTGEYKYKIFLHRIIYLVLLLFGWLRTNHGSCLSQDQTFPPTVTCRIKGYSGESPYYTLFANIYNHLQLWHDIISPCPSCIFAEWMTVECWRLFDLTVRVDKQIPC